MAGSKHSIKVCYFPGRETGYPRNRLLVKAMKEVGIEVLDCSYHRKTLIRYIIGFVRFLKYKRESDIVFVGFLGHFLMPLVKLFTRKKIIFDSFVSIYLTIVVDRKITSKDSLLARFADYFDWLSCRLANIVFAGTTQEIKYLVNRNKLPRDKFVRVFVGSDDTVMYPRDTVPSSEFIVEFHGEFQALHGVTYIIEAASILTNINFKMIGDGVLRKQCMVMAKEYGLKNIEFIGKVSYEQIPQYIAQASVCLGIFGDTEKTQIVIPHKAYEALAMGKPLITADTPAARELLTHRENAFLCNPADPKSLAEAIKTLYDDEQLRKQIAENGYKLFKEKCSPEVLGRQIRKCVESLIDS